MKQVTTRKLTLQSLLQGGMFGELEGMEKFTKTVVSIPSLSFAVKDIKKVSSQPPPLLPVYSLSDSSYPLRITQAVCKTNVKLRRIDMR